MRMLPPVVVLAAIIGIGFSSYSLYTTFMALHHTQADLAQSKVKIAKLSAGSIQDNAAADEFSFVEPATDYPRFMSTFILQASKLAMISGCTIKTISPKPENPIVKIIEDGVEFQPVDTEIRMSASSTDVDKFLDGLSRLSIVAKVTRIELSRQSAKKDKLLDVKLGLILCLPSPNAKPS